MAAGLPAQTAIPTGLVHERRHEALAITRGQSRIDSRNQRGPERCGRAGAAVRGVLADEGQIIDRRASQRRDVGDHPTVLTTGVQ